MGDIVLTRNAWPVQLPLVEMKPRGSNERLSGSRLKLGWGRDRKARGFHAADAGRSRDGELPGFFPNWFSMTTVLPLSSSATSSLLKNPRQNESSLIQFFNHESVEARMRGAFTDQGQLFSYISPEARVRTDHPLRKIQKLVRDVLGELNLSLSRLYASEGRPSIPPEQLLSALLLQVFYGIRSERQLMEELDYNLLYRWFVGLSPDDLVWDPTVFTKNRDRLQSGEVFAKFM